MAALKTQPDDSDVAAYLSAVADEKKRADCFTLLDMMQSLTGETPKMWGGSMVGFGSYHYKYESGRSGTWFLTGFAPRKQNLTIYLIAGAESLLAQYEGLGKYKLGKGCLYVKSLADIDLDILKQLILDSVKEVKERYKDYN